jgi:DNA-binding PadR family transcriptional regulator
MNALEFHVLLALGGGALHGYAIKDAITAESRGSVAPRAGSLYRVLARLLTAGLITETSAHDQREPHPGLARR